MGISTITLSHIAELTASVGAPRVAAIEHPLGRTVGAPGDAEGQRAVLLAALEAAAKIEGPGGIEHLPFQWSETPREARAHPPEPPPIVGYLKRHPWHLPKMLSREIPERDSR